jgi:membrane protease YdiL (CAAX protease family)
LTDLSRPDGPAEPDDMDDTDDPPAEASAPEPPTRTLGLTAFTMDGRRAPALFVVGWLATLLGVGFVAIRMLGVVGGVGLVLWYGGLALATIGLVLLGGSQAVERRAAGAAYAGPSPLIVLLAVLAATQVAGLVVGLPLSLIGASIPRPVGDLIAVSLQALVVVGVVGLMVVGADALRWSEMGLRGGRGSALASFLGGAVFAGPIILITAVVTVIAVQLAGVAPASPLPPTGTPDGLVLHLLAGAVIAPFAEELLFRGFALTAWRRAVGDRAAIIRSSVVFVLAHVLTVGGDSFGTGLSLAFVAGVARIPVALALGWLFTRTGSLWAPIGLHAAYNAILIVIAEAFVAQ